MSRVSQEQAVKNKEIAVAMASKLIRRKGVNGVGVREMQVSSSTWVAFGDETSRGEAT